MPPHRERRGALSRAGWMGMGQAAGASALEVGKILAVFLYLFPAAAVTLQCKILTCNSDFWAATSGGGAESEADVEFCAALRAYSSCVRRTARACRGDLAFHLAQHGIEDLMTQNNCSKEGPTASPRPPRGHPPQPPLPPFQPQPPPQPRPPQPPRDRDNTPEPDVCHYERRLAASSPRGVGQPNYTHCGFFGDPHLRTFTDDFQTCKVEGAWPLVHNKYLSVQVTNTPVVPGSAATATSKLTIIFKNFQECVEQKMYHAETDELPAAFADGSRNGGDGHGASSLQIVEKVPGQHVEIQARYIGTTIVVRQVGRYLTFAVRMPDEVVHSVEDQDNQDLYLCLHGCPTSQRIDFRSFRAHAAAAAAAAASKSQAQSRGGGSTSGGGGGLQPGSHPGFTYQAAVSKCKERLPVEDMYFHSCVFDLLLSGDINFTMAAFYALEDVKVLHSNKAKHHIFERDMRNAGGSHRVAVHSHGVLLLLLNLLLLALWTEGCSTHL